MNDMTAIVTDELETTVWRTLREHLRRRRVGLGMSQEALGSVIGCDASHLSRWECGDRAPSLFNLMAWVESLGLAFHVVATEGVPKASTKAHLLASTSMTPPISMGRPKPDISALAATLG